MSGRVEHIYELVFFAVFITPLIFKVLPGFLSTLQKNSQSRKDTAQSILEEIRLLETQRAKLTSFLEAERSVRSGVPHYLSDFESMLKEEITQRKELVLQELGRKMNLERERTRKVSEVEIFRESFSHFRGIFIMEARRKHAKTEVLLKDVLREIEKQDFLKARL